jgi:hypothetical protein
MSLLDVIIAHGIVSSVCLFQDDSAARAGDERVPHPLRLVAPLHLTAASTEVSTTSCSSVPLLKLNWTK